MTFLANKGIRESTGRSLEAGLYRGSLGWLFSIMALSIDESGVSETKAVCQCIYATEERRWAPGRTPEGAVTGNPDGWFDPTAFVLQPAGTLGDSGRGAFTGPDLQTVDLSLVRFIPLKALSETGRLEIRVEAFNVLNRANFGNPSLLAFTGTADNEAPLSTFGRIRSTVTSSRQIQIGIRVVY